MSRKCSVTVILSAALLLPLASGGLASERRTEANRPPQAAFAPSVRNQALWPEVYGNRIGETKPGEPNAVYWRGRHVGTDPDPQVRAQMLRHAISGGG